MRKVRIKTRLLLSFFVVVLAAVIIGSIGFTSLIHIGNESVQSINNVIILNEIDTYNSYIDHNIYSMLHIKEYEFIRHVLQSTKNDSAALLERLNEYIVLKEQFKGVFMPGEIQDMTNILDIYVHAYVPVLDEIFALIEAEQWDKAWYVYINRFDPVYYTFTYIIGIMLEKNLYYSEREMQANSEIATLNAYIMLVVAFISLIASVLLSLTVTRSISVPLSELGSAAEKIANGETDVYFEQPEQSKSNDEISRLSLRMQETLLKMRMADEQTQLMLDATPLCCSLWDRNRNNIACNQATVTLFGLSNKQEYSERFIELSPKYQPCGSLSIEKMGEQLEKALQNGYCRFEWLHQTLGGKAIPCEVTLVRVKYKDDYIVAVYNRDLREYKKIMNELGRRDELLNTVNEMSAILLKTDIDTFAADLWQAMGIMAKAVYADRAYIWKNYTQDGELYCSQIYEWSEGAEPQQDIGVAAGISYENVRYWKENLSGGRCINSMVRDLPEQEQEALSPQGILSVFVVPVFLNNYFWGFVGFDDCRSERLFTENEEMALRSACLSMVNALNRIEQSEQRAEAEAANRAKSAFLAMMSHEIRTPMNAIIGIAQIQLQNGELPSEYAIALEKIYHSGKGLLGIINDILDMSRIEMGKLELNPMDYDVASLINDAVQLNIVRIASKPIEFILNIDGNMPAKLCGDELRIKQILSNLLSNAIKYTEKGSVKLSVSHLLQDGDVELRFAVEDTGQGIKPDDQKRLFAEFTRFNKESNRATEGTGLGLSIAKRLAEMMDGAIEVKSEYGKGSVFTVKLKQKIKEHGVIGEETADRLRNFTFAGGRQLKEIYVRVQPMPYGKVLVVDDVDTNLYVAAGLLAKYGLDIETANSGFGAIEKINAGKTYDVIFMDQMMPKMDGIETAEKLRALGYKGAIVALTANALAGNHEMFMQKGFDGFIPKPIDIRQLDAVLVRFVRERHPEAANAPELPGSEPGESKRYKQADAETAPEIFRIFCGDAKKAAETLRETLENGDMKLFALTAHAMKSALANVGEYDMSGQASDLEVAGTYGDTGYILERTESFAEKLEALISKFNPADQSSASDADISENKTYLIEQLQIVKSACEDYNANAVYAALDLMSQEKITKISMKTAGELEKIRDMLFIYSEFDEAAEAAGELIKKLDLRGDKKTTE